MITVYSFTVNPFQENSYLLTDETRRCVIVDAGFYSPEEKEQFGAFIEKNELLPIALVNTHCHFDHLLGIPFLKKKYDLPLYCHRDEAFWLATAAQQSSFFGINFQDTLTADHYLDEGDEVRWGNSALKVIHVPGHSRGHLVLWSPEDQFLLTGDVLFRGSIGRTDLEGGNYTSLVTHIHRKLMVLPDETVVYSGHGPATTIGAEKSGNPFLKVPPGE